MRIKVNYTRPFLYPYQTAILNSPARYTVVEASTKVGKTASHIIWLFEQALVLKDNQSVWWVAPTIAQAKIAFNRMRTQVSNKRLIKVNHSTRTITLPSGAKIEFKTASDPDALFGDDVYAFVFDEFTRAKEAAWVALRSTITSTGGKGKFIGNAKGKKNWGHKLAMRAKNGDSKDWEYFKITAYDAADAGMMTKDGRPFIEEIEDAKRDLPEAVFNELYLAEPSEDGQNPFGFQYIKQCTFPLSTEKPSLYGIDLAKHVDWTVIIGLDKTGRTAHFDRFQMGWTETTSRIVNLPNNPITMDSTGAGDPITESVQRARSGIVEGFVFTERSRQQLLEKLALAIQHRQISFPEGVIADELEQFEFVYTRTGVKYAAPQGEHDDCVMALALAWWNWDKYGKNYASSLDFSIV